jgi:hypothetical protein
VDEREYRIFMAYLYDDYVRFRSRSFRKYFHNNKCEDQLGRDWERLIKASNLVRYINHQCRDEDEIYHTITRKRIAQLPDEIRDGTITNRKMLEKYGFMEAIDAYYDEIVGGMKLEHMPPQEIEVMRELGSSEPEAEL